MQNRQNVVEFETISLPDDLPLICFDSELLEADANNAVFTRHLHDILEIGLCRSGYGVYAVDSKLLPFQCGDMVIIGPRESHYARSAPGVHSEWTWIFVDPARALGPACHDPSLLATNGFSGPEFHNVLQAAKSPELQQLIRILIRAWHAGEEYRNDQMRGLMLAILACLHHSLPLSRQSVNPASPNAFERLRPALQRIHQQYYQKLQVADLAKLCHISVSGFRQHFSMAMGCSPMQYLQRFRVSMSCAELLQGGKTVEAVAAGNGFPTLSCFVRQFVAQKGVPPRKWTKLKTR